ncbi:hypothetical protein D3C76_994840 [compost metagenome]
MDTPYLLYVNLTFLHCYVLLVCFIWRKGYLFAGKELLLQALFFMKGNGAS